MHQEFLLVTQKIVQSPYGGLLTPYVDVPRESGTATVDTASEDSDAVCHARDLGDQTKLSSFKDGSERLVISAHVSPAFQKR